MPVHRLVKQKDRISLTYLTDNTNIKETEKALRSFPEKLENEIYLITLYLDDKNKERLNKIKSTSHNIIIQETGDQIIYDKICGDGKINALDLSLFMLPYIIPSEITIMMGTSLLSPKTLNKAEKFTQKKTLWEEILNFKSWRNCRQSAISQRTIMLNLDLIRKTTHIHADKIKNVLLESYFLRNRLFDTNYALRKIFEG